MPMYTYKDVEKGIEWEEYRPYENRLDGVDNKKIFMVFKINGVDPTMSKKGREKRQKGFENILDRMKKNIPNNNIR